MHVIYTHNKKFGRFGNLNATAANPGDMSL